MILQHAAEGAALDTGTRMDFEIIHGNFELLPNDTLSRVAAKTLALTAMDLFQQPDTLVKAKAELLARRGPDFVYEPLVGNRKPPLDYRN